jgi:hypothetical protein
MTLHSFIADDRSIFKAYRHSGCIRERTGWIAIQWGSVAERLTHAQQAVGMAIAESGIPRSELFITTKVRFLRGLVILCRRPG